jgi:hypothetical protein
MASDRSVILILLQMHLSCYVFDMASFYVEYSMVILHRSRSLSTREREFGGSSVMLRLVY